MTKADTANIYYSLPLMSTAVLDTINHSVNFFLYIISGKQFRKWFVDVVCCRKEEETPSAEGSRRKPYVIKV